MFSLWFPNKWWLNGVVDPVAQTRARGISYINREAYSRRHAGNVRISRFNDFGFLVGGGTSLEPTLWKPSHGLRRVGMPAASPRAAGCDLWPNGLIDGNVRPANSIQFFFFGWPIGRIQCIGTSHLHTILRSLKSFCYLTDANWQIGSQRKLSLTPPDALCKKNWIRVGSLNSKAPSKKQKLHTLTSQWVSWV